MYIEKSYDWGQTWKIYRYFAYDCAKEFPGVHIGVPRYLNETVCQGKYSKLAPSTKGEVDFCCFNEFIHRDFIGHLSCSSTQHQIQFPGIQPIQQGSPGFTKNNKSSCDIY